MSRDVRILVNPSSGQGRGARFLPELRALIAQAGIEAEIVVSENEAHMRERFVDWALSTSLIVAVGGDTTFTIMAHELWRIKRQSGREVADMGWIGVGTANDLLRGIGLEKPQAAVKALVNGRRAAITLGEVSDDCGRVDIFLGSVGIGAAPMVNAAIEQSRALGRRSHLRAELWPGLQTLWRAFRQGELPFNFELDPDRGRALSGMASLILLLNIPHFSRGIVVNDFAGLESPFVDWTVIASDTLWGMWAMQQRLSRRRGEVVNEDIQLGQASAGTLRFAQAIPYLVDGILCPPTRRLHFRALPQALNLRLPME